MSRDRGDGPKYELFNIGNDPFEKEELAQEHPDRVKQLAEMITADAELDGKAARDDVTGPMVIISGWFERGPGSGHALVRGIAISGR